MVKRVPVTCLARSNVHEAIVRMSEAKDGRNGDEDVQCGSKTVVRAGIADKLEWPRVAQYMPANQARTGRRSM